MIGSDEEVMARAATGEIAALGLLFDRHQPAVLRFLCRFLGDFTAAEDAAQETFWRVWRYRSAYHRASPFLPWLFAVARRAGLDAVRRDPPAGPTRPEAACAVPAGMAPDRLVVRDAVRAALIVLPEDQRVCVALREYEGWSYREIGAVLGCTEGAARVLAHRARAGLRERLRPLLQEEESCV